MRDPSSIARFPPIAFVCLALLPLAAACTPSAPESGWDGSASADTVGGEAVAIASDRTLWLECRGEGEPTVILESGIHDSSDAWVTLALAPPAVGPDVFAAVAQTTRVCRYDRPGTLLVEDEPRLTDRSSPVPMPRTVQDAADDLEALLAAADVTPPYLLVGHSFGGFLQTYYAQTHPDDVAGLVLVDAFSAALPELLGDRWPAYERVLNGGPTTVESDPDFERWDMDASVRDARDAPRLRSDLPVVVISKTEPFALPAGVEGFTSVDLERAWSASQTTLVEMVPETSQLFAGGSDHIVQAREPDLVAAAIGLLVHRIRGSVR